MMSVMSKNKRLAMIILTVPALLLIPLIGMQFSNEINWSLIDFVVMGLLLLGVVVWQFTKARIDRKIREEMPDGDEEMEEGGAGGSRLGTLLLLVRKFLIIFIVKYFLLKIFINFLFNFLSFDDFNKL